MNTSVKLLSASLSPVQLLWSRNLGHSIFILALFAPHFGWRLVRTGKPALQLTRSLMLLTSSSFFFFAIGHVPLADATSLGFTAPFIVALLAGPALGERVGLGHWLAIATGFGGALIVIRPTGGGANAYALLILGSAACYAVYQLLTRRVAGIDPPETSVTYSALMGTIVLSVLVAFFWRTPSGWLAWGLFTSLGLFGGLGHYFVARGFLWAPASILSPMHYVQLIWAATMGYLVFGDVPSAWTWLGAAVIIASGLWIAWQGGRRLRAAPFPKGIDSTVSEMEPIPAPPRAPRIPRFDVLHGDRREDDYFWLRQKGDPEVTAYLEAENAYAAAVLGPIEPFQEALYAEMLARIKEDDQSVPHRRGGHFYYVRTEKGKQYPIYCRKAGSLEAPEEITLDLNALAEGHPFLSLGLYAVSDDGRRLAYSLDYTGFREYTLFVKDLGTGALLPDRVEKVSTAAWAADPAVLFYVVEDHAKRPYRLYRHRLGTDPAAAALLYEEADELFRLGVWRSRSRAFVFAGARSFTSAETRYLDAADPWGPWQVLARRAKDHEYDVDHGGAFFYLRTNGGGRRNFRLVRAPVSDPGPDRWEELIPHRDEVMLEEFYVFAGHHVVHERAEGLVRLRVSSLRDGSVHHVEFPEPTYEVSDDANAEFDTGAYRLRYESLITPPSVYDYDIAERRLRLLKQTEVLGGYDPARYRSERLHATAPDGTRIPISLVTRADTPRDGTSPLDLVGYGAYGIPYPVLFSSNRLSLLDRGVSVAIAHVRGGGELGKRWHDQGRMLAKVNTFTDFIAVAEFLIAEGYTAADRLAIEGGSAGGLLVGAVLNMRPELFRAAVLRVPFVDVISTMLDEALPLTVGEFEEWGNPKIREHYEYMKRYCPYTNAGRRPYPAMLVRTSLHDSQVMYWEPAKYVAKLRAAAPANGPLLLRTNMDAGHGGASGRYDALRESALDFAFILTQVGRAVDVASGSATVSSPR